MKHRVLSVLLALTFLLSVFMFCTTAFASEPVSNAADGLSAVLDTDKDAYEAGETINVTLDITNTSIYVNNIRSELIIPVGTTLEEGILQNVAALKVGENVKYTYVLSTPAPTTQAPTTQAPTTQTPTTEPGGDNSPETRDITMLIYGSLAIVSLLGLIALTFGAKLMKQRWLVLVVCAAMLLGVVGPLAVNAAVSEKSFEIVKAITIDGTAAEVKAIVTYDLDDNELMESTDVPYKAEGQFLWNLGEVEQGYYLPSDVKYDGKTTSKDGTYRPEVNAPYIDMLFGTAKVSGMCKAENMFNAEAEKSVLVGRTDDYASLKALDHIDKNEWIVTVIDGKLVVTGWYDDATVAAVKWLKEQVTANAADITLKLPYIGKVDHAHSNVPEMTAGTFMNGMNSDQGSVMLRWADVTADDFKAYTDALAAAGYKLYSENTLEGYGDAQCLFATYVKGEDVVHVQYLPSSLPNATAEAIAGFSSAMKKAYEASYRSADTEIRLVLESTDNLFPIDDPADLDLSHVGGVAQPEQMHVVNLYTGYADGNDVGACHVFTLADGSFFVWDGGLETDAEQLYRTLKYLNKRDDGIVIAGWVLTHAHNDHIACYQAMATSEWAKEITVEKVIVNRLAESYSWRGFNDPYGYAYGSHAAMAIVENLATKFAGGEDVQIVVPHMGQVMEIRNLNIETLTVGDEDIFPVILNNDNAGSHVAKITFDGIDQVVMMLADSCLDQTYNVFFPLMLDELDADILQAAHHGLGGNTSRLYPIFNMNPRAEKVAIWNTSYRSLISNNETPIEGAGWLTRLWTDMNKALRPENGGAVEEDIVADEYVTTLNFPYAPGESQKMIIGQNKSDFFDYNNVKVAYLPAFRFQNTFDTKQAEILAELASYDADVLVVTQIAQKAAMYENQDMVGVLAKELGYAFYHYTPAWGCDADNDMVNGEYGTMGHLVLSRYPIAKAENITLVEGSPYRKAADGGYTEGRAAAHVVLDMEGMLVDIYATHFDNAALAKFAQLAATEEYRPAGSYWMIVANNNKGTYENTISALAPVAAGLNNGDYEVYASAGAAFSEPKVQTSWAGTSGITGNQYMGNGYTFTLELSRKVLCNDMVIGEFDDIPTVGQWWVNWRNDKTQKEQVLRWLLQEKPEIVGLVHVPSEVTNDEGAAEFAKLAGYEYYSLAISNNKSSPDVAHLLLSHYPIEDAEAVVLRAADDATAEGRCYGHAIVTMPDGKKVDVYFGENDSSDTANGGNMTKQREILEAAVKETVDTTGRDFIILGYVESHIKDTYAGVAVNTYHTACSIVVSKGYPMDAMRTYGTKAYPTTDGKSPIGTTIANIDQYMKVELADVPEYKVTVNNGTGDGNYQEEEEVTVTADAAAKGMEFAGWTVVSGNITLDDPMAKKITFTMPAEEVVLTANYKAVAYTNREEIGETKTLEVAVMPAFRFKGSFTSQSETILNNLKAQIGVEEWADGTPADILALTLMDYDMSCGYNKDIDMIPTLVESFKDIYPYYYYAPNQLKGTESDTDPNAGYLGHVIFSKYPFDETRSESIELNTESNGEIRSAGHVVVNVGTEADPTWVDVYFTHMGASSNWTSGENNLYEKVISGTGDAWLILGNARYTGMNQGILGTVNAAFTTDINILGSSNVSYANAGMDKTIFDLFPYKETSSYVDPLYFVDVTVPLYKDAGTNYPININGETVGWYKGGSEVTLTAPAAEAGLEFDSWTLPASVNADASSETITFTMPNEILNLTVSYKEVTTATVTFDANGGFGSMEAIAVNVGAYTVPADCGFLSPAGAVFKGWSTTRNGEVVTSVDVIDDTTLYAVWEYTGKFTVMNWWANYNNNADNKAAIVKFIQDKDYDIVTLFVLPTDAVADDAAAAAFAANFDYPYYRYATTGTRGSLTLSKFPLGEAETLILSDRGNIVCHVSASIYGNEVDIYNGDYDHAGALDKLAETITARVAATGNEFIIAGYNNSKISSTAALKDLGIDAWNGSYGGVSVSSGITMSEKGWLDCRDYGIPYGAIDHINVATLDMPARYTAGAWYLHYYNATYADQAHATLKVMDKDFVIFSNYNSTVVSPADAAAAAGYPYYHYTPYDMNTTSGTGNLLLSKYPIVETGHTFSVKNSNARCYTRVQVVLGGELINMYYGQTEDGGANRPNSTKLLAAAIQEQYQKDGLKFVIMGCTPDIDGVFAVEDKNGNTVPTSWNGYDGYGYVLVSGNFEALTNPSDCMIPVADMKQMLIDAGYIAVDYPKYTGKFVTAELLLP